MVNSLRLKITLFSAWDFLLESDVAEYELNTAVAVEVIDIGFEGKAETIAFQKLLFVFAHTKTDTSQRSRVISNGDLQMVVFGSDSSGGRD